MPKARAVAEAEEALAAAVQGVAPAERAVAPAELVVAPAARAAELVVPAPVLEVLVRGALARVVRPAERVLVQVARVRALELVQVARVPAPALELARVVQPADRAAPVLPARLVVVPGRREQVAQRVLAVAAGPVGQAAERVALKSLRRSCAARRRCIPAPGRMYLSSCGLSAASATTRVKRAVLSSKPW
jgi:hypothetical protein